MTMTTEAGYTPVYDRVFAWMAHKLLHDAWTWRFGCVGFGENGLALECTDMLLVDLF